MTPNFTVGTLDLNRCSSAVQHKLSNSTAQHLRDDLHRPGAKQLRHPALIKKITQQRSKSSKNNEDTKKKKKKMKRKMKNNKRSPSPAKPGGAG